MKLLLDKQFVKSIPKDKRQNCQKKIVELLTAIEEGNEQAFLSKYDGKQMQGTKNIYKFRATEADRIIYVRTNQVEQFKLKEPDSLLLLRYTNHDEQGNVASRIHLGQLSTDDYEQVREYQTDFCFTDETTVDEANRYFARMPVSVIFQDQLSNYLSAEDEAFDVLLNDEQSRILRETSLPLILYGCAGSGKTILCAHILFQLLFYDSQKTGLYTSMSRGLNEQVRKLFKNIQIAATGVDTPELNIKFVGVADLMRLCLGWSKNKFVQYEEFNVVFSEEDIVAEKIRRLQQLGVSKLDIWAEIRGLLKGHLDEEWMWNSPISFSHLSDSAVHYLRNNGLIKETDSSCKWYCKTDKYAGKNITSEISDQLMLDETLSVRNKNQILSDAHTIDEHFVRLNKEKRRLSEDEYLSLNTEYSVYDDAIRHLIYEVLELYEKWLLDNNYHDDNDLAREYIVFDKKELFNYIAIDEVQDLTEMQILALYKSCIDPLNMIFAGDVHQVINPTYFSEERIKKLYYMDCSGQRVTIEALKKNYRSQDKIVDLANDLSGIRKRRIGSRSQLSELSEVSAVEGWNPMQLASTEDNLRQLINTINELPYAAVIVQDENDQGYLASLVNGRESGNIYTIQEIKGLEKKYVVCYNIASLYSTIWKDIFSEKDIRKNAKYRYYFNTFYVAVTRSQSYLCFFEDSVPENMQKWLNGFTDQVDQFDRERLFLSHDANAGEHWYQSAQRCEQDKDYERAVIQYKKSSYDDYLKCVSRCKIKQLLIKKQIDKAVVLCFQNQDFDSLNVIAEDEEGSVDSDFCRELYSFMNQNVPPSNYRDMLEKVLSYKTGDQILNLILDKIAESSWLKIESLTERISNEVTK